MRNQAYISGDVSKGYCDFLLLGTDKQILEEAFVLGDTRARRKQLSELIQGWFDQDCWCYTVG